ncbi:DUF1445 domain-containing protein [Salipaludibacillus keqinensis]|uniref:Putative hydro-lyase CR194_05860 n=1 Tax=Salipaludibacillus keqinensis TaxID=2045207 RepID=A0A323TJI8_9BACI|nr:putative hydro-lyase [Salipaludibacillus keqinensis]PYZ95038.1 DUF1445 domain-containing protein [Salipaludibacillus keqinensis]
MEVCILPDSIRRLIRSGKHQGTTSGYLPSYIQTNVVILPKEYADEFREFTKLNPKSCPLLDELAPGEFSPALAKDADIRTDVPQYRVYRSDGQYEVVSDIRPYWQSDFVTFLIGCSFTFESALQEENITLRHVEENVTVPMYKTNIQTVPSGPFSGPMVVSMRPIPASDVDKAIKITGKFPSVHGSPIHAGDPSEIGIVDIRKPDYGDTVTIRENEIPVFWACGVTPQQAILHAKLPIVITHEPGKMFVTDVKHEAYRE